VFFRHNDLDHLEALLRRHAGQGGAAIAVDGVYSMQGDLAPLPRLVELKREFGARLLLDDAHGTGVFGPQGRGTAFHFGLERDIDLHLGTFSKAIGTMGGFAAGDRRVIDLLRFSAPTLLFTKSLPLAVVAATSKALELLQAADAEREKLWNNAQRLQNQLTARGFDIGTTQSPITPVQFNGTDALRVGRDLRRSYRIWASPVLFPAVELGKSIIRLTPTALHQEQDLDQVVSSLAMTACSDFFSAAG
jgi:7-keto-8-aminopelargonate synthetase-like enzyme